MNKKTSAVLLDAKHISDSLLGSNNHLQPQVSVSYSTLNMTGKMIGQVGRNGVRLKVPSKDNTLGVKRVEIQYRIQRQSSETIIDLHDLLDDFGFSTEDITALVEKENEYFNKYRQQPLIIDLVYVVTLKQLEELGGSVYIKNLDLLLSLDLSARAPTHPYSNPGVRDSILDKEMGDNLDLNSFRYEIKLVDNNGQYGNRFINIANSVYKLEPIKDPRLSSGIYITQSKNVSSNLSLEGLDVKSYSWDDEFIANNFFRTYEEAKSLGDSKHQQQKEILEYQREKMQREKELELAKQSAALKKLEEEANEAKFKKLNEEIERLQRAQIDAQKIQKEEFKQRKEIFIEILKILPTIIGSMITLKKLWDKFHKKDS